MSTLMTQHNGMVADRAPVIIGNASAVVLAANPKRKYAVIYNTHATNMVWLSFAVAAVAQRGYPLAAGSMYVIDSDNHTTVAVNGISPDSNVTLTVLECQ
jgi:hypothetical protein